MDWELHPESPVQLTKNQRKEKTIMNKKRILSALLAVCMVFSMVLCIRTSVCAKTADGIKIVFDGKKSITLNSGSEPKTLKEVEKKWGEKTRLAADDEEYAGYAYVWEKGKSKITIRQPSKEPELNVEDYLGYTSIEISDKNASVAGVKVGMKSATALKKLRKAYGKKNVTQLKDGKTYTEISLKTRDYMPVSYIIKNGKISGIYWMRS